MMVLEICIEIIDKIIDGRYKVTDIQENILNQVVFKNKLSLSS